MRIDDFRRMVDDIATVTDEQLVQTMRFFAERMKMVVEPTGALPAAALMLGRLGPLQGARVGAIVSGGNVDSEMLARLLAE